VDVRLAHVIQARRGCGETPLAQQQVDEPAVVPSTTCASHQTHCGLIMLVVKSRPSGVLIGRKT
jgi:hypothetical protein